MYRITFAGKVCNYHPYFSSSERAWDYVMDMLCDERAEAWDNGTYFDFDHALSFYGVVKVR